MSELTKVQKAINEIRQSMGDRLLMLGHHYQRPGVLVGCDFIGDSLELAKRAAETKAEKIVFCGVHFMAESADILSSVDQQVYLPVSTAGCPMADMADVEDAERAWQDLGGDECEFLPVVYVNSTAEIKAFCGRHGGSACTSSNAPGVIQWVFDQGKKLLFLPDEHLGVNTAHDLGISDDEIFVYDPGQPGGGLTSEHIESAKVIVWKGFCHVHKAFKPKHIEQVREHYPDAKIIVHPETPKEATRLADAHGSTSQIIEYVKNAPEGSEIFVGTELNLVQRLAEEQKQRVTVRPLHTSLCTNMAMTSEEAVLDTLQNWPGKSLIRVDEEIAVDAKKCLDQMLKL